MGNLFYLRLPMIFFSYFLERYKKKFLKLCALLISLILYQTAFSGLPEYFDLNDDISCSIMFLKEKAEDALAFEEHKSSKKNSTPNKHAFKNQKENMVAQNKAYQLCGSITAILTKISISINDGKNIYTNEINNDIEDLNSSKTMNELDDLEKTDLSTLCIALDHLSLYPRVESSQKKKKISIKHHIEMKPTSPMFIKFQQMINEKKQVKHRLNDDPVSNANLKEFECIRLRNSPITASKSTQTDFEIPDNNANIEAKSYSFDKKALKGIHDEFQLIKSGAEKFHKKWFSNESFTQSQNKNHQSIRNRAASAPPTKEAHTKSKDPRSKGRLRRTKSMSYDRKPYAESMKNYNNYPRLDIPKSGSTKSGLFPIHEDQNLNDKPNSQSSNPAHSDVQVHGNRPVSVLLTTTPETGYSVMAAVSSKMHGTSDSLSEDPGDHNVGRQRSSTISFSPIRLDYGNIANVKIAPSGSIPIVSDSSWPKINHDKARKRFSTRYLDEKGRYKDDTRSNSSNSFLGDSGKKVRSIKRAQSMPIQRFKETSI